MFMERLNNSSSVLDKFISTYFLGRISKKLEDDNKVNNEQILTPHSDSLPTSIDISPASNN